MINNLAELKRYFQNGGAISLQEYSFNGNIEPHKWQGIVRKPAKVQTNSIKFEGGSWLAYAKASCYTFTLDTFTVDEEGIKITYKFIN